jgi:hypothetical protein
MPFGGRFLMTVALVIIYLAALGGVIYVFVRYLRTLQRALQRCSIQNRSLNPDLVYLQLIPGVGTGWQFVNVICVARSLEREFASRGVRIVRPGQTVGVIMASLQVAAIALSYLGRLLAVVVVQRSFGGGADAGGLVGTSVLALVLLLAAFILWIIYWSSIARFNRQLDAIPAPEFRPWGPYQPAQVIPQAQLPPRSLYCWSCAARLNGGRFCSTCGADQTAWAAPRQAALPGGAEGIASSPRGPYTSR